MATCWRTRCFAASILAITFLAGEAAAESFVFAAGFNSDNVVRFNLVTGASEVIANFTANDRPTGIALDAQGDIYVALRGGTQNIVKLIPDPGGSGLLIPIDFTESIGGFGPSNIAFNHEGELLAAGNASHVVFRYNGTTGGLIDSFTHFGCCNLVGLMVDGDLVYASEFFQRRIVRFDLSIEPVASESFIPATDDLDHPLGMTIGHTGNLFVANTMTTLIQEFDSTTGAFLGTWLDVSSLGFAASRDIEYVPQLGNYFITQGAVPGNSILRVDSDGNLVAKYQSAQLDNAWGVAVLLCEADINGDAVVNVLDLIDLLLCFGQSANPPCDTGHDVNGDGTVNVLDLIALLREFGTACP